MNEVIELESFLKHLRITPGVGFICAVPMGSAYQSFWRQNYPSIRNDVINFLRFQKSMDYVVYINLTNVPDDLILQTVLQRTRKKCFIFYSQRSVKRIFSRWGHEMKPSHCFQIDTINHISI